MTAPAKAAPMREDVTQAADYIAETLRLIVLSKKVAGPLTSRVVQSGHLLADLRRLAHTARPDAGDEDVERARRICADHDPDKAYQYLDRKRDNYMPMTAVLAAMREGVKP